MASGIQVGDRVRVTAKSRLPGYALGETGTVLGSGGDWSGLIEDVLKDLGIAPSA